MKPERVKTYLEVLACPKCKGELSHLSILEREGFFCLRCKLLYPIEDDIPQMLLEAAIPLEDESPTKG